MEFEEAKIVALDMLIKERELDHAPDQCYFIDKFDFCPRKRFMDSHYCFWHSDIQEKTSKENIEKYFGSHIEFRQKFEEEAKKGFFAQIILRDIDIGGCDHSLGPNVSGVDFSGSDFRNTHFSYTDCSNAKFVRCNLEGAYFSQANLNSTNFFGARLFNAKFRENDFSTVIGLSMDSFRKDSQWGIPTFKINEEYPHQCQRVYQSLVGYFSTRGAIDDASWAAYRERVMHRRNLWNLLKPPSIEKLIQGYETFMGGSVCPPGVSMREAYGEISNFRKLIVYLKIIYSYILSLTTGYGEKPSRPLLCSSLVMMSFSVVYWKFNVINSSNYLDNLYFSIVTFTTLGYGDFVPAEAFRLLAASEALLGLFFTGLFLFTLGRRSIGRS
jgi:hypothetical protein